VALATTGLGLYQTLSLPLPGSVAANVWVLIYGGSTSTGTIAIQFAKLSGAKVVTTCSPRNIDHLKSLGADEAFDYNDPECATKIRQLTNDQLHFALDCFGGETGTKVTAESISSKGGHICMSKQTSKIISTYRQRLTNALFA
jgi:NADPH:quinone reductase-like Zn-dependent oxidoreductase